MGRRLRIAILDDWLGVAPQLADWRSVEAHAELVVFHDPVPAHAAAGVFAGFDIIVPMRDRMAFPAALLEALPRLRLIAVAGQTPGRIDTQAADRLGIEIQCLHGNGAAPYAAVEVAWVLILSLSRQLPNEMAGMGEGRWQRGLGETLAGRNLGLLGLGRLGKRMVPVARAFGMEVCAWSPNLTEERACEAGVRFVTRDELFRSSNWISLHLKLSTQHIVGAREISLMRTHAYLINTARAGLVDTGALMEALRENRIAGAGIDCFDIEPLPPDHELRRLPNVVLTPHIGFVVRDQMAWLYRETAATIETWLDGGDPDDDVGRRHRRASGRDARPTQNGS